MIRFPLYSAFVGLLLIASVNAQEARFNPITQTLYLPSLGIISNGIESRYEATLIEKDNFFVLQSLNPTTAYFSGAFFDTQTSTLDIPTLMLTNTNRSQETADSYRATLKLKEPITTPLQFEVTDVYNYTYLKEIKATIETTPVSTSGDSADDSAIWVNPQNPELSLVIGTEKLGRLIVYDLAGHELQAINDGRFNNVDLRTNFPFNGENITLVAASNRTDNSVSFFKINPSTRNLEVLKHQAIPSNSSEVYGLCMYHSPKSGKFYVIVNELNGFVQQWEVNNNAGQLTTTLVRSFGVGSQTEGCVTDDNLGYFYIGEEDIALWQYLADPEGGITRTAIDIPLAKGGHFTPDIEGITLFYLNDSEGYLIASSQGDSRFTIYERAAPHAYLGAFRVINSSATDGVTDTDGIDVTAMPLGAKFPHGMFVVQDNVNSLPDGNQNFKFIPWQNIANALNLKTRY